MGKKRIKRFLTVYTVSYGTSYLSSGTTHTVTGSYFSRGDAIRECADLILDKLEVFPQMRTSFLEGKNNFAKEALESSSAEEKDIAGFFKNNLVVGLDMPRKVRSALRPYLIEVLGENSCYVMKRFSSSQKDELSEIRFDIDENDVECKSGMELWTCVTSGVDHEEHDPEWEQAYPEVFLSEGDAVDCAMKDIWACLDGNDKASAIMQEAADKLESDGFFEYELDDSKTRRWDVWMTPVDIGHGSGKVQRP